MAQDESTNVTSQPHHFAAIAKPSKRYSHIYVMDAIEGCLAQSKI
jgi:hypothetical protein